MGFPHPPRGHVTEEVKGIPEEFLSSHPFSTLWKNEGGGGQARDDQAQRLGLTPVFSPSGLAGARAAASGPQGPPSPADTVIVSFVFWRRGLGGTVPSL